MLLWHFFRKDFCWEKSFLFNDKKSDKNFMVMDGSSSFFCSSENTTFFDRVSRKKGERGHASKQPTAEKEIRELQRWKRIPERAFCIFPLLSFLSRPRTPLDNCGKRGRSRLESSLYSQQKNGSGQCHRREKNIFIKKQYFFDVLYLNSSLKRRWMFDIN